MKKNEIQSYYLSFIKNEEPPISVQNICKIFKNCKGDLYNKKSDEVLKIISKEIEKLKDFGCEKGKKSNEKITIKIENDNTYKYFCVDAFKNTDEECVILEVESGRAVANYQFLKDIFETMIISSKKNVYKNDVKIKINSNIYLVVAVRNCYRNSNNFNQAKKWLESIKNSKLNLRLNGIFLIGY